MKWANAILRKVSRVNQIAWMQIKLAKTYSHKAYNFDYFWPTCFWRKTIWESRDGDGIPPGVQKRVLAQSRRHAKRGNDTFLLNILFGWCHSIKKTKRISKHGYHMHLIKSWCCWRIISTPQTLPMRAGLGSKPWLLTSMPACCRGLEDTPSHRNARWLHGYIRLIEWDVWLGFGAWVSRGFSSVRSEAASASVP